MSWLTPTDIVIVTGGSHGLGDSILKEFARKGCQTVSLDIAAPEATTDVVNSDAKNEKKDDVNSKANELNKKSTKDAEISKSNSDIPDEKNQNTGSTKNVTATAIEPKKNPNSKDENETKSEEQEEDHTSTLKDISNDKSETSVHISGSSVSGKSSIEETNESTGSSSENGDGVEVENLKPTLSIDCDVRSVDDLKRARDLIFKKFNRHPTVLVLNAAIRRPLNSIAESSYEDIEDTIDVNLNGVFKCLRTFLPDFIKNERGFITTIASALGIVVPKGLGTYGASKAALIGMHEALTQEVSDYKDIHALLVCPGQLDTAMFQDVTTPSELLAPVVSHAKLAEKIVKRIAKAKTSTIYSPTYVRYLPFIYAIPTSWARLARRLSGVDKVYDDMVAKRNSKNNVDDDSPNDLSDMELSVEESNILTSSEEMPELHRYISARSNATTPLSSIEKESSVKTSTVSIKQNSVIKESRSVT